MGDAVKLTLPVIDDTVPITATPQAQSYQMGEPRSTGDSLNPHPPPSTTPIGSARRRNFYVDRENLSTKLEEAKSITAELLATTDLIEKSSALKSKFHVMVSSQMKACVPDSHHRSQLAQRYMDSNLSEVISRLWKAITSKYDELKPSYPASHSSADLWNSFESDHPNIWSALTNFSQCLVLFWNATDIRERELQDKAYNSVIKSILEILKSGYFLPLNGGSTTPCKVVKACLGTLHNFCHNSDWHIPDMRQLNVLKVLKPYVALTSSDMLHVKMKAVLSSSYLLTEEDSKKSDKHHLKLETETIEFLVKMMKEALEAGLNGSISLTGYHEDELMNGLNNIASIDVNKQRLINAGVLPLYVSAMKSPSEKMREKGTQGIWTLSFDDKAKQQIKSEPDCVTELERLDNDSSCNGMKSVKKAVSGALWQIDGEDRYLRELKEAKLKEAKLKEKGKVKQHLMISYNWGVQPQVLQFKERLTQAGFRVWIDVNEMYGSTMGAMADAVEKSAIFIPVVTEKYKNSQACRQEAEYASKRKKIVMPVILQSDYDADGWLGLLMGTQLYYNLTKPEKYEETVKLFLENVEKTLSTDLPDVNVRQSDDDNDAYVPTSHMATSAAPRKSSDSTVHAQRDTLHRPTHTETVKVKLMSCYRWSKQDVTKWLREHDLQNISDKLEKMDGALLAELIHLYLHHPDVYFSYLKGDYRLSLHEVLTLNSCLRIFYE